MKLRKLLLSNMASKSALAFAVIISCVTASAIPAAAQSPTIYRGIRVDMSGIPSGARQTRDDLQVCLSLGLPRAFAGRIIASAQGAPLLIVRPTSVWLAPLGSSPTSEKFGTVDSNVGFDSLEGEAIIGNRRMPIRVSAGAPSNASTMSVDQARMRTISLCNSFVGWVARQI
jgi:hypothetical protein